jgi:NADPH2:quinone reductase
MQALVMTEPSVGPDHTEIRELAAPRPAAGQVSIDVAYAGINFIDVMARRGDPGYASSWPCVPGLEVAGTIRELGRDVTGLSTGQRVAAFTRGGGLAQVALAEAVLVAPLPAPLPFPVAAAAPLMLTTGLLLLTDVVRLQPGERVLMHSASGGVGTAVAQLAPVLGAGPRIGTVGRTGKAEEARRAGWDVVLVRDDRLAEAVRAVAAGGVDVILDPAGTALLEVDLEIAAPGARIVLFGNPGGGQPAPLPPLARLIGGNVSLAGFSMSRLTATAPRRAAAALRRVIELLDAGLDIAVTELTSLQDVPAVHQRLAEGRGHGKYVVSLG